AVLGRARDVDQMLATDPGLARATGAHGIPVMFHAVLGNNMEILQHLVENGADVNAGDGLNTALHAAAVADAADIAQWLLVHGADPRLKDYAGKTPMQVALEQKRHRVLEVLQSQ